MRRLRIANARYFRPRQVTVAPQKAVACHVKARFNSTGTDVPSFAHVGGNPQYARPAPGTEPKDDIDYDTAIAELEKLDHEDLPKLQWTGYGHNTFEINELLVHGSVIATPSVFLCWKPKTAKDITVDSLSLLKYLNPKPELLILGTGNRVANLSRDVHEFLHELSIGVEVQKTGSALGTFLVLNGEEQRVVGAFLQADVEEDPTLPQPTSDFGDGPGLGSWSV